MLDGWGDHPAAGAVVEQASQALGEDIGRLIKDGPKDVLALTTNTQPVMLVAGVAAYRVWQAEGGAAPAVMAGHSLGEYAALVCAGVLTVDQAAPLVRFRAQAMQEAVPVGVGAMAAILGLAAADVIAGCAQAQAAFDAGSAEVVEAVNFNDPMQTVIAGSKAGVEKACEVLKTKGAKRAMLLPVSAPFHSSLMKPAAERLRVKLAETFFAPAQIPVVNNVDVAVESDPDRIRDALYRQAFRPVRWVECVSAIRDRGIGMIVESGPGKALTGMTKRIDASLTGLALYDRDTLAQLKGVLA